MNHVAVRTVHFESTAVQHDTSHGHAMHNPMTHHARSIYSSLYFSADDDKSLYLRYRAHANTNLHILIAKTNKTILFSFTYPMLLAMH
eukprot:6181655-Pleurochrysis_carterae.AAC.1